MIAVGFAGAMHVHQAEGCSYNAVSAEGGSVAAHLLISKQDGVRPTANAKATPGDGSSADVYLHFSWSYHLYGRTTGWRPSLVCASST